MSETPGDRVQAFLNAHGEAYPHGPYVAYFLDAAGKHNTITQEDLRAILRTNRSLAQQIVGYGDRIIEASQEIQRATLRAVALECEASGRHDMERWLLRRAEAIGRKDPSDPLGAGE